jgi:hypothetical protein
MDGIHNIGSREIWRADVNIVMILTVPQIVEKFFHFLWSQQLLIGPHITALVNNIW